MIIAIESDLPSFKPIELRSGLNILLSDKSPGSSEKQTRNSAGKSSVLEILHFLLGSKGDKNSLPRNDALIESTFYGTFEFRGQRVQVGRTGADPRVRTHNQ